MPKETLLLLGASSDFGGEILKTLDDAHVRVVAHYHQTAEKLDQIKKSKSGFDIQTLQADLATPLGIKKVIQTFEKSQQWPTQIVHLPAPKSSFARMKDLTWDRIQKELDLQARSLVEILQACLPAMAAQEHGKIVVFLSSYTLQMPPKYLTHYVMAKYALWGLVRSLASEYADKKITINAVSPSLTETAFLSDLPAKIAEMTAEQSPLKRNAKPADVAPLVHFLLSPGSDYITGTNIPVSGGTAF